MHSIRSIPFIRFAATTAIVLFCLTAGAQARMAMRKGLSNISIGAGLANSFGAERLGPGFRFAYDYAFANAGGGAFSIGGVAGYSFQNYKFSGGANKYNNIIAGVRFAYHNSFESPIFDGWVGIAAGARYNMLNKEIGLLSTKNNEMKAYYAGYLGDPSVYLLRVAMISILLRAD
jgi:hypothetical protein